MQLPQQNEARLRADMRGGRGGEGVVSEARMRAEQGRGAGASLVPSEGRMRAGQMGGQGKNSSSSAAGIVRAARRLSLTICTF